MPPPRRMKPQGSRRDALAEIARRKQTQANAATAAEAARRRATEQQRYYQGQQKQARAAQEAQARAAQEAMKRRAAEQQVRLVEQRRQEGLQRNQARSDATRKSRLTHVVKKGDTAESIGAQYGLEPSRVAGQVPRLRPGQRLTFDPRAERVGEAPARGGPFAPALAATGPAFAQKLLQFGVGAMPTVMRALARFGEISQEAGPLDRALGGLPDWQTQAAQQLEALGPAAAGLETSPEFQRYLGGDVPPELEPSRPGGIQTQMTAAVDQAKLEQGLFAHTMRYVGSQLGYAYGAMIEGDPDWDRYLKDSAGNIVMVLTDGRWDRGPMKEQFTPEMWGKVEEMGFVEVEEGLYMVPTMEAPGYGMGGYEFPGYGGGYGLGGGGGGDYEYLSRGGILRRKEGGGVSTGERYRVFPEGVSPAHWRI